ncbi:hypothetical protein FQR65_LT15205 [Abscondita terminalis]|nr:hypothetical protein FQR65_LT15205 [Abscondita terminalis]
MERCQSEIYYHPGHQYNLDPVLASSRLIRLLHREYSPYQHRQLPHYGISAYRSKKLANGKYQVDIAFQVAKYRVDKNGKRIYDDSNPAATGINPKRRDPIPALTGLDLRWV